MDAFLNTAKKMILVKDMTDILDFDLLDKVFNAVDFRKNQLNEITIDLNLFDNEILEPMKDILVKECEGFLVHGHNLQIGKDFESLRITNSWANLTKPGHAHHIHNHPFSVVSGVLFLDDNPSNLNLVLETYLPDIPYFSYKKSSWVSLGGLVGTEDNLKNHLILFLSNTEHQVDPTSETDQPRRTIAFNTFWKGTTGEESHGLSHIIF
jgi:Putative 2OG-Fe(II) oxygenase